MGTHVYDLIIIGAGPAGMTAAVYAARKKLDFILISEDMGGQAAWSGDVENYTGYQFITGPELALKFHEHITSFGIDIKMPQSVRQVTKEGNLIKVQTNTQDYISKAVIIATGKRPRKLNVPGEEEFRNKGVTYCATCDGPLFKDKNVVVIGGGNSGLDAVLQLMNICPQVHLLVQEDSLNADPVMSEKARKAENVKIWYDSVLTHIKGDDFVSGISFTQNQKKINIEVKGVFVEIGLMSNSECAGILDANEKKEIMVDLHNRTSVEGIFAAGDVTDVPEKQIIIACGEGAKACLSGFRYLSMHNF
jgi:alkyl hydroperoxide reductase subunit F